jgi:hypothetical protein
MTVTTNKNTATGSFNVTVTGVGNGVTHTATVGLTVN